MYECMTPCVGERQHGSMSCRLKKWFSHRDLCNERLGSISYMHRAALRNGTTILKAYTGRGEAPCAKPLAGRGMTLYVCVVSGTMPQPKGTAELALQQSLIMRDKGGRGVVPAGLVCVVCVAQQTTPLVASR